MIDSFFVVELVALAVATVALLVVVVCMITLACSALSYYHDRSYERLVPVLASALVAIVFTVIARLLATLY